MKNFVFNMLILPIVIILAIASAGIVELLTGDPVAFGRGVNAGLMVVGFIFWGWIAIKIKKFF